MQAPSPSFNTLAYNFTNSIKNGFNTDGTFTAYAQQVSPLELKEQLARFGNSRSLTHLETAILLLTAACELQGFILGRASEGSLNTQPTPYTISELQYLLAGSDEQLRESITRSLLPSSTLVSEGYVLLTMGHTTNIFVQSYVSLNYKGIEKCLSTDGYKPAFGPEFPARRIGSKQSWNDLILSNTTMQNLNDIQVWLQNRKHIADDPKLAKAVKPGYRALFYGPPGTGKTFTASLLGQKANLPVYCIDLSLVVSKYIGETEKNLETVFRVLENEDCILFFDEADSLFGKRTSVSSSNDRYANQEVSYLLQRLEDFKGLTILASNLKGNIDQAFTRRFNSIIYFNLPGKEERMRIWQQCEPQTLKYAPQVNLNMIADRFELSGATILNSVYYAYLNCKAKGKAQLETADIIDGIRKEYAKMEKTMPVWVQSDKN
ncbi:MAG: ATP-binding protein [Bacteroidetes bacterium]|nr:ATP-binding protein [Bacteroidota bacterium]